MLKTIFAGAILIASTCSLQATSIWTEGVARYADSVASPDIREFTGVVCKSESDIENFLNIALLGASHGFSANRIGQIVLTNIASGDPAACELTTVIYDRLEQIDHAVASKSGANYFTYAVNSLTEEEADSTPWHEYRDPYPNYRYIFFEEK